jgi:acetyltransferase-like isoleucine patch superfamily enzyme
LKNSPYSTKRQFLKNLCRTFQECSFFDSNRNNAIRHSICKDIAARVLTDDERASFYGLPSGCSMREGAKIIAIENLQIGEHCWIGENAILDASGGLSIGSHCSIGLSVFIWSHSSHLSSLTMQNQIGNKLIDRKSTTIGDGCFIAGPSVVQPGVHIGNKVLVKPFSTIDSDIPDRSIVSQNGIRENVFTDKMLNKLLTKQRRNSS